MKSIVAAAARISSSGAIAVDGSDNGARYFTGTRQVVACRHDRPGAVVDQGVAEEALAR